MNTSSVRIVGLRELQRDLLLLSKDAQRELRTTLREAAEPVRVLAERKAVGGISHIGDRWSRMRIGVTNKMVYVAPRARRRGGSPRRNLAPLLMDRAMEPALEAEAKNIEHSVDGMIYKVSKRYGF